MKYNTLWLSDSLSSIQKIDFTSRILFITEGQSDKYIPINDTNFYILHNCNKPKYKNIIKDKRTYVNRIKFLLNGFNLI